MYFLVPGTDNLNMIKAAAAGLKELSSPEEAAELPWPNRRRYSSERED